MSKQKTAISCANESGCLLDDISKHPIALQIPCGFRLP